VNITVLISAVPHFQKFNSSTLLLFYSSTLLLFTFHTSHHYCVRFRVSPISMIMMIKASMLVALFAATAHAFEVTSTSCIESGSDLEISFINTKPKASDWIGIVPATGNELASGVVGEPLSRNWMWTCGSQSCDGSPSTGTIKLTAPTVTAANKWIAVLGRNDDSPPYRVKAVSSVILVKSSCSAPTVIPQAQPVSAWFQSVILLMTRFRFIFVSNPSFHVLTLESC
jgi:hypothetical protein